MTCRRLVSGSLVLFAALMLGAPAALAVAPDNDTTSCNGVFHGAGDGPLTKTFVRETDNGDGTFTLVYTLTTPRPTPATYRVRDCAFVDANRNGQFDSGEPLFGTDDHASQFTSGTKDISITVQATSGEQVCDRAALSSDSGGFTDKSGSGASPFLCQVIGSPPPIVPETGKTVVLAVAAMAIFGLGFFAIRRRTMGSSSDAVS